MRSKFWAIALSSILIVVWVIPPAKAQIPFPFLPNLQFPSASSNDSDNKVEIVSGWILLDGRRLFQIAAPKSNFSERSQYIQQNLDQISQDYFQRSSTDLTVQVGWPELGESKPQIPVKVDGTNVGGTKPQIPVIYVNGRYLMTITDQDAKLRQQDPSTWAPELSKMLEQDLKRAYQERQPPQLVRQGGIAAGTGLTMILISLGLYRWQCRLRAQSLQPIYSASPAAQPLASQLNQQQHRNLKEVQRRLFQLAQAVVWGGGTVIILSLFPYTRPLLAWSFIALQRPLRVCIVVLGTYVSSRLSYALIDRFTSALISGVFLTPETSQRLQLRVSTISGVAKSIATITYVAVGILVALIILGIDIGPLLAGAGLIGVAVSVASQNLIKDAINGFLIITEDQYGLGDVIMVGTVGGLVEKLNLRITQVRDAEGRLITIPNSEIKIVANLSSRWSRADLNIPVAYNADIDQALKLIDTVVLEMSREPKWREQILEHEVLGVENFADRGLTIRVWIKTQPLKQWDVAREYRRRLKVAFDRAGIAIPLPEQIILVNDAHSPKSQSDSKGNSL